VLTAAVASLTRGGRVLYALAFGRGILFIAYYAHARLLFESAGRSRAYDPMSPPPPPPGN
jgi:hypothetical protein